LIARSRGGRGSVAPDPDAILKAAHDLIRRGASPERAVEQLTRSYPEALDSLVNVDAEALQDPRFPYFRTRPGRLRLQEIRDILAKASKGDRAGLAPALVQVVANAIEARSTPEAGAEMLAALVPVSDWMAFANLDLEQLVAALRLAARQYPSLGTPRARGAIVSMQDALKARGESEQGIVVGWLVRAGGPGRRGETLKVNDRRTVIGQAATCGIRLTEDSTVVAEHAEITMADGEFTVAPLGGAVRLEGAPVDRPRGVVDGETLEIGANQLVFKSASVGNLIAASGARAASPNSVRGKR
jgi:hypothetical protein